MTRGTPHRLRFDLDKSKIFEADVFLFVLNRRVPDERA
jgi:hypothetical protein